MYSFYGYIIYEAMRRFLFQHDHLSNVKFHSHIGDTV